MKINFNEIYTACEKNRNSIENIVVNYKSDGWRDDVHNSYGKYMKLVVKFGDDSKKSANELKTVEKTLNSVKNAIEINKEINDLDIALRKIVV